MAPIRDETVEALKDLVHKLESRVEELEAKLHLRDGGSAETSAAREMRMILMGPPGAGMRVICSEYKHGVTGPRLMVT